MVEVEEADAVQGQVVVRVATEDDIAGMQRVFLDTYASDYPYKHFFEPAWLRRSIYGDDILMLVAQDEETSEILGTASIVLDVGANSDLVGEFGRLAVHPEARGRGIARKLMQARLTHAESRLHVAVVEARTAHPYSQKIALSHGFVPVGFLPQKHLLAETESVLLLAQHFGRALELRRNNPHLVPELKPIAHAALSACGIADDTVVDESAPAFPSGGSHAIEELTADQFIPLLRIARGRTRQREVFGAKTLQHGFFKLSESQAQYLVARGEIAGELAGAIGFIHQEFEKTLKLFELVFNDEDAVVPLLQGVLERARTWEVRYIEIDVNSAATSLQRTLLQLGFVPVAYIPAMVFADTERLDVARFAHLSVSMAGHDAEVVPSAATCASLVQAEFSKRHVLPALRDAIEHLAPFEGVTSEQAERIMAACELERVAPGEHLFEQGGPTDGFYVVLEGSFEVERHGAKVGTAEAGELLGELGVIAGGERSATATARDSALLAHLSSEALDRLVRVRPDIGVVLYRNFALALGIKLRRLDDAFVGL